MQKKKKKKTCFCLKKKLTKIRESLYFVKPPKLLSCSFFVSFFFCISLLLLYCVHEKAKKAEYYWMVKMWKNGENHLLYSVTTQKIVPTVDKLAREPNSYLLFDLVLLLSTRRSVCWVCNLWLFIWPQVFSCCGGRCSDICGLYCRWKMSSTWWWLLLLLLSVVADGLEIDLSSSNGYRWKAALSNQSKHSNTYTIDDSDDQDTDWLFVCVPACVHFII